MADRLRSFRIGLGALCTLDLLAWVCGARTWLTDDGVVPRSSLGAVAAWPWRWSLLHHLGSVVAVRSVLALGVVGALLVMVGRARRPAALALAVVLASVHARAPFVLSGADLALGVLAVWWAVLVWVEPYPLARRFALAGSRLQIAAIYAVPLLRRTIGGTGTWLRGHALGRVLALRSVTRAFPADLLARLPSGLLRLGDWLVLLVETALVVVIVAIAVAGLRGSSWRPRGATVVLTCGVLLHVAMGITLRLGLFPLVLPVAYLLFVRDADAPVRARAAGGRRVVGGLTLFLVSATVASVVGETLVQVARPDADPTRHVWSPVLAATGLWQRWELFSPDVPATDRWVRVESRTAGGRWRPIDGSGPDRGSGAEVLRRRKLGDNARRDPVLAGLVLTAGCRDGSARVLRLVRRDRDGTTAVLTVRSCGDRTGAGRVP